jgi:hypothetical protein
VYEYGALKLVKVILRREKGRGRIMEGMNQPGLGYIVCIRGKVPTKPPVQLSYTNKNTFKKIH